MPHASTRVEHPHDQITIVDVTPKAVPWFALGTLAVLVLAAGLRITVVSNASARSIWRATRRLVWPIRPGLLSLMIALIFPIYALVTSWSQQMRRPMFPPDWVWFAIVFVLAGAEAYFIQRDGIRRDEEALVAGNRMVESDRLESSGLLSSLLSEMPQREAVVSAESPDNRKAIVTLAASIMRYAQERLAGQPEVWNQMKRTVTKDGGAWILETHHHYEKQFAPAVREARDILAAHGLHGQSYEEAVYDSYRSISHMLKVAELLSRLALRLPAKGA